MDIVCFIIDLVSVFCVVFEWGGLELIINCLSMLELVYFDWEMWEKIVLNLFFNVFKFIFEGSVFVLL